MNIACYLCVCPSFSLISFGPSKCTPRSGPCYFLHGMNNILMYTFHHLPSLCMHWCYIMKCDQTSYGYQCCCFLKGHSVNTNQMFRIKQNRIEFEYNSLFQFIFIAQVGKMKLGGAPTELPYTSEFLKGKKKNKSNTGYKKEKQVSKRNISILLNQRHER